jgi:hypothetical protein
MNGLTAKYQGQKKLANDELARLRVHRQQVLADRLLKSKAEEQRSMAQQSRLQSNILEVKLNLEEAISSIDYWRQSEAAEDRKVGTLQKELLDHLKKKEEANSIAVASRRNWFETRRWLEEKARDGEHN